MLPPARLLPLGLGQKYCDFFAVMVKLLRNHFVIDAFLDSALGGIRTRLDEEGINYKMIAKQLYHDREEITVFLTKTKK